MNILKFLSVAINIIGGLGLFLYGLKILSQSLERMSSEKLKSFFNIVTKNKLSGVFFGTIVTCILQSSSATTVLMIGFINAGLIKLTQGICIIFGANIGTTITAQIIAFKASAIALPLIGIGAMIFLFSKKQKRIRFGEVLIGLGMLFYGLKVMGSFLKPLKDSPAFLDFLVQFGQVPVYGLIAGLLITVLLQSSSATTGMIITLGSLGMIDFQSAFCLELGSNIGTTVTAQLAAIGANKTAKRAAWAHTLFNVIGSGYMLILLYVKIDGIPVFLRAIDAFTPGNVFAGENLPRHFANAHTFFNVFNAIILFPFIPLLAKITERIIPGEVEEEKTIRYLDPLMAQTPSIALNQAKEETMRMIRISKNMTQHVHQVVLRNKETVIPEIKKRENKLNEIQTGIVGFIAQINHQLESKKDISTSNYLIHISNNVERIGDRNSDIIHYMEMLDSQDEIPKDYLKNLKPIYQNIHTMFQTLLSGFNSWDESEKIKVTKLRDKNQKALDNLKPLTSVKIQKKELSPKAGITYMDILNDLDQINHYLNKVAYYQTEMIT